ncbi:recombinase family protein [Flavobacteriaceae bacterium S0825]|uniref:recombinase family protein n=1 Tax=Gaetbulibacter sp. S0825 TaxID=2720084 RepID=UPI0014301382|nr:recombinase family protein [Gaetbulibacter sp. S0825]MCK0108686.1 recombinase family protein [Flavobacteriaceae bacterium S0825]NIX64322.1 recombinase family protein [Gaetbulibacter sp. S0825]
MEKAILICRCSTTESKQDVTRQSQELRLNYSSTYTIVKEFSYYKSGTKNDAVNDEILEYAITNNVKHIIASEISRISRKISSFALFLEKCNANGINIIIDNYKLHTLLENGEINGMVQTMLSIASTFASAELRLIKSRLDSGRAKYIKDGGKLGRKQGSVKDAKQLLAEHSDIVKFVKQKQSVRNIMALTGKSSGTVQKIRRLINNAA